MAVDFRGKIKVNYNTDLWGVYTFYFPICTSLTANDGLIPYGDTVSAVVVRAFLGNVKATSDLDDETELETLVDPDYEPTISGSNVSIKLQYPTDTYKGLKYTLIFEIELTSGGTHAFYFQYVYVL